MNPISKEQFELLSLEEQEKYAKKYVDLVEREYWAAITIKNARLEDLKHIRINKRKKYEIN